MAVEIKANTWEGLEQARVRGDLRNIFDLLNQHSYIQDHKHKDNDRIIINMSFTDFENLLEFMLTNK